MADDPRRRARRDPVRTRRLLLDAAAAAVSEHGSGVSLETVARTAGISKSGLMHHFGTKDDLFAALATDAYQRFAQDVEQQVEPADLAPGRVMRAYVRAVFAALHTGDGATDFWSVEAQLSVVPAVAEILRAEAEAWSRRVTADGFDRDAARFLLLACSGVEAGAAVGVVGHPEAATLRDQLLHLTRCPAVLAPALTLPG